MSLILDALKRAEREHSRDLAQRVGGVGSWPRPPRRMRPWYLAGSALAAALLVYATWWSARWPPPVPEQGAGVQTVETRNEQAPARSVTPQRSVLDDIELAEPVPPAAEPAPRMVESNAPFLQELPQEVRSGMPSLQVNAHVWSQDPERRMVMINMRSYREGEQVAQGLHLLRVLPDGAELEWRNHRFRIAAR